MSRSHGLDVKSEDSQSRGHGSESILALRIINGMLAKINFTLKNEVPKIFEKLKMAKFEG